MELIGRRLIKHHVNIINGTNKIFIAMSKGEVSDKEISKVTNRYKNLLMEMYDVYRCIRILFIDDTRIDKTRIRMKYTMILWRELKVLLTTSAHLLEDNILTQMNSIDGGIADKTEDHIERSHQVGKHFEQRYTCVTDFTQLQTSQIKLQDLLFNLMVKVKLEQVKIANVKETRKIY